MREQEFRDALKQQVGQTGLSSDRQAQVLAGKKGGEGKVRTWNKMKLSLVLAALVVLSVGVAVATEIVKYVNWDGEPVDYEGPAYTVLEEKTDPVRDPIADELIRNKKLEEILQIFYPGRYNAARSEGHRMKVASLEELRQLAGDDTPLLIPTSVPEGFTLTLSHVFFTCRRGTTYRLLSEEMLDYGIRVQRSACEPEDLFLCSYFLYFENPEGERLNFSGRMLYREENALHAEDAQVKVLQVTGMEQAICFDHGSYEMVRMRRALEEPIDCQIILMDRDGIKTPNTDWQYFDLDLQANSTICDVETMLSCFGLTTE